jgi:hypothetical protein
MDILIHLEKSKIKKNVNLTPLELAKHAFERNY